MNPDNKIFKRSIFGKGHNEVLGFFLEKSDLIAVTKTFLPFCDYNHFFFKQPIFFYFGDMVDI